MTQVEVEFDLARAYVWIRKGDPIEALKEIRRLAVDVPWLKERIKNELGWDIDAISSLYG